MAAPLRPASREWTPVFAALLLSGCSLLRPGAPETTPPPKAEPAAMEDPSSRDQVQKIKYLRLEMQLKELRAAGADDVADDVEAQLGAEPTPEAIDEASKLVRKWLKEDRGREPAYCADAELRNHMYDLMMSCEHAGRCKEVTDAEPYFATDAQYKRLVALMPKTTVFFRIGRYKVDRFGRRKLRDFVERHVDMAQAHSYVFVIGRASKIGDYRRNLVLAVNRARSVVKALRKREHVLHDIGFTAYAKYTIYITPEDGSVVGEDGELKMSEDELNQSATVFLYECPKTVKQWKAELNVR